MATASYETLVDPQNGDILGATLVNRYVKNALYLHGLAAGGVEPFQGVKWKNDSTSQEAARWYFIYRGVKKVYNNFTDPDNAHTVYVENDSSEESFSPSGGTYANPLALTGSYTLGKKYYIRWACVSTHQAQVDFIYVPTSSTGGAWAAPNTVADADLSDPTDFSSISAAEAYLKTALEVPRGNFAGLTLVLPGGGTSVPLFNGSFIYTGLDSLEILAGVFSGNGSTTCTVKASDIGGANVRTLATISTDVTFTTPIDLSGASPAFSVGTRYRLYIEASSNGTPVVGVKRLYLSGTKALTNNPAPWNVRDYVLASSGANRLDYIRTALNTVQTLAQVETISAIDYGVQYPAMSNVVSTLVAGVTLPTFIDFRRLRRYRWLFYLPTATGASGRIEYASDTGDNAQLDDLEGDGSWQVFDLDSVPLLPPGYVYKVTGVKGCFESSTSS